MCDLFQCDALRVLLPEMKAQNLLNNADVNFWRFLFLNLELPFLLSSYAIYINDRFEKKYEYR